MFPDPRRRRPRFEFPGSAGAGPRHQCVKVKSESEVAQWCPTRSDPMDCSPPGSSINGVFQARGLEWLASHITPTKMAIFKKQKITASGCEEIVTPTHCWWD